MKWCCGMALVLILAIHTAAMGQTYGSGGRLVYSGYRVQERAGAEALPPAAGGPEEAPAAEAPTRVRRSVPAEGAFDHWQGGVIHDDYYPGSNKCCTGLWRRPCVTSCSCRSGCGISCGCGPSVCGPSLLERVYCNTQANMAAMQCRIRNLNASIWGTSSCRGCGKSTLLGGCGCGGHGAGMPGGGFDTAEVWQDGPADGPSDPLTPRPSPAVRPAPQDAPGPHVETETENRPARRYVPSTVVPSSAWKFTPIRSSF